MLLIVLCAFYFNWLLSATVLLCCLILSSFPAVLSEGFDWPSTGLFLIISPPLASRFTHFLLFSPLNPNIYRWSSLRTLSVTSISSYILYIFSSSPWLRKSSFLFSSAASMSQTLGLSTCSSLWASGAVQLPWLLRSVGRSWVLLNSVTFWNSTATRLKLIFSLFDRDFCICWRASPAQPTRHF